VISNDGNFDPRRSLGKQQRLGKVAQLEKKSKPRRGNVAGNGASRALTDKSIFKVLGTMS
jgi:hypothetical protein